MVFRRCTVRCPVAELQKLPIGCDSEQNHLPFQLSGSAMIRALKELYLGPG